MDNQTTLEELKKALKNYKKGKYTFGKYATGDQIEQAFLDGKIFVLKRTKKIFLLCISVPITAAIIAAIMFLFVGPDEEYLIIMLISFSIAIPFGEILVIIICISVIRWFVVIGPSGVYYRRVTKKGYFEWKNITLVKGSIHTTMRGYEWETPVTTARVIVILPNNKEVLFDSGRYGNKEFVRKVKRVMFLRLFQIYSELGKS